METNESPLGESTFRSDETRVNTNVATRRPQVELDLPDTDADRDKLSKEFLVIAKADLLQNKAKKYPRSTAHNVDPEIPQQSYTLISLLPSKGATPDKDGCFGLIKVRGTFSTEAEAEKRGEFLIKDHDSMNDIDIIRTGTWVPFFTKDDRYAASVREIDTRKKVAETHKDGMKAKREEEEKNKREIGEQRERLQDPTHSAEKEEDDPESITYFIKIKQKRANALVLIEDAETAIEKAKTISKSCDEELETILAKHPNFKDEYLAIYNAANAKVGISPEINQLYKHMK